MMAGARAAVAATAGAFGGIDVLVSCVGIFDFYRGLADIDDEELDGTLGTELTGPASLGLDGRVLGSAPGREQDLRDRTPLRVALTGEDHAGSYVFLASQRARGITGTIVHSDGSVGVK